jgi:hypothetical protein
MARLKELGSAGWNVEYGVLPPLSNDLVTVDKQKCCTEYSGVLEYSEYGVLQFACHGEGSKPLNSDRATHDT